MNIILHNCLNSIAASVSKVCCQNYGFEHCINVFMIWFSRLVFSVHICTMTGYVAAKLYMLVFLWKRSWRPRSTQFCSPVEEAITCIYYHFIIWVEIYFPTDHPPIGQVQATHPSLKMEISQWLDLITGQQQRRKQKLGKTRKQKQAKKGKQEQAMRRELPMSR